MHKHTGNLVILLELHLMFYLDNLSQLLMFSFLKVVLLSLGVSIAYGEQYVVYPKNTTARACAITSEYLHLLLSESNVRPLTSEVRGTTEFWLVRGEQRSKPHNR